MNTALVVLLDEVAVMNAALVVLLDEVAVMASIGKQRL